MSGHSHWSSIKHQKGTADAKRGKTFSKLSRQIEIAAKEGGKDPEANPKLRIAVEKARDFNMPKDNIERAIKRGSGELACEKLEPIIIEALGPANSAIIIEGITTNKNRSISEIRQILSSHNGKLAGEGAVKWNFERKGIIVIKNNSKNIEETELKIIEAGAENIEEVEENLEVQTKPEEFESVKKELINMSFEIIYSSLDFRAKEKIKLEEKEKESCRKLFEALDENEAVLEIYSNVEEI
ncbi:MAG: YebC/PmpR family DNA-binding transcriptional regulator [Candidatus Pacebacteria bacterium]|nr:YebC/PmpR family DNA-binding transcriptional regulator [Candidatus Paceibacterota bacterium]MDD3729167.1 YebC/PmpR family DNA-binding transcriptional regulator [Candidatus Paceibacterota bacterium]MDD4201733.1 YebC/PmpR family DNA-binding transcriptional regulator [Candidatus Paceibacterota bacterium]MDD4897555.1 YebC/PmpR family DNA-binding transcriptional regulator [Candidatus Paceibacterota bacterium]MDD5445864.1 YebC/PmpR family DNA-binding transcriptional regulator [Candidatus Paceibact